MVNFDKLLERAVNVLAVAACLVVGIHYASTLAKAHRVEQQRWPTDYVGKSIADVRPNKDAGGVLVFVSPTCIYCEQSLPFYRELSISLSQSGKSFLVTFAGHNDGMRPETKNTIAQGYVVSRGLQGATAVAIPTSMELNIRATPALMTYDSQGIITGMWRGLLDSGRQKDLLTLLSRK